MRGHQRSHRIIAILAVGSGLLKSFPVLVLATSITTVETTDALAPIILLAGSAILLILGGFLLFSKSIYWGCILLLVGSVIRLPSALSSPPMPDLFVDLLLVACSVFFLIRTMLDRDSKTRN